MSYSVIEKIHDCLIRGIKDYFGKMGFKSATLGLSGGIDSAAVAVLAARAAFKSAELNVYVNVSSLKDREFASKKIDQIKELGAVVEKGEQETFDYVKQVILKI